MDATLVEQLASVRQQLLEARNAAASAKKQLLETRAELASGQLREADLKARLSEAAGWRPTGRHSPS